MTWSEIILAAGGLVGLLLLIGAIHPVTRPIVVTALKWGGAALVGGLLLLLAGVGLSRGRREQSGGVVDLPDPVPSSDDERRVIREEAQVRREEVLAADEDEIDRLVAEAIEEDDRGA